MKTETEELRGKLQDMIAETETDAFKALPARERMKIEHEIWDIERAITPRFNHVCKRCEEEFSNIVEECDLCCVCAIRVQREEWED